MQNAALETAHLKSPSRREQDGSVDASWLTEAFQETVKNTSEAKGEGSARKAKTTKVAETESDNAAVTVTSTATSAPKKGVVGEQSSLAKGLGPVLEIRKALGGERLHGLGWTREHLAFVLRLSVVRGRKLEREGTAPVKSKVAREKLLELAKSIKEPNEIVKRLIEESEGEGKAK